MALAHTVADPVEAAYRRGDLFAKRRQLAEAWGKHGASAIIGSCGSLVGFAPAPGDDETAEFLSKAGGMVGSLRTNASDDPQGGPAPDLRAWL